jgi:hypothetical protein
MAERPRSRATTAEQEFRTKCAAYLKARWEEISEAFAEVAPDMPEEPLGAGHPLIPLIRSTLTSKSKSYHYVLPAQVLAKCINPALDAHAVQAGFDTEGAYDARTPAHKVIVPFDQQNFKVLGGSPEPYANNPLRIPAITKEFRSAQKRKGDWDNLVAILDAVQEQNRENFTQLVFDQVLYEIYKLLADVQVTYPTPNRISLDGTYKLVNKYLVAKAGGDRIEVVTTALFRAVATRFHLFDDVRREKVNAADQASGMTADIECWADGKIVLLVEVKDRALTLTQLSTKLDRARAEHIAEVLFVAQQGKDAEDQDQIESRIGSEFTSGQNIYVAGFADFAFGVFILLGEDGRVDFLSQVGAELDRNNSAIEHRKAWADLLRQA